MSRQTEVLDRLVIELERVRVVPAHSYDPNRDRPGRRGPTRESAASRRRTMPRG